MRELRAIAERAREALAGLPEDEALRRFLKWAEGACAGGRMRASWEEEWTDKKASRHPPKASRHRVRKQELAEPGALGWLYQYWVNADRARLAAVMRRKEGDKIGADEVIAATCVYTPREHVRFLLENSLGRMSGRSVRDLTVIDPACGSGHMLVEAFSILVRMYREEEPRRGVAWACRMALSRNLCGMDIDARAVRIARMELAAACGRMGARAGEMNIVCAPGLGALGRGHGRSRVDAMLRRKYSVVVMNPPYVGFRKLAPGVKRAMVEADPLAASDMAVAFLSRGFEMVEEGGMLAAITPAAWLTSRPALGLRRHMLEHGRPVVVKSLGQRVFETAPLLFVSMAVVRKGVSGGSGRGRTGSRAEKVVMVSGGRARKVEVERIREDPSHSFAPSSAVLPVHRAERFAKTGDFFVFADGVWTGDNARDTRARVDVAEDDPEWFPAAGGLGHCRWYGPVVRVLRASAAREWPHVDRRAGCLEYSRVAGGKLAARMVYERSAAIAGVVSMFLKEGVEDRRLDVLAMFNSRVGTLWLRALTSGLNFNPGYAARVPIPREGFSARVRELAREAVEIKRKAAGALPERLSELEREIDGLVAEAMGVRKGDLREVVLPRDS
jgi:hypothetical protein